MPGGQRERRLTLTALQSCLREEPPHSRPTTRRPVEQQVEDAGHAPGARTHEGEERDGPEDEERRQHQGSHQQPGWRAPRAVSRVSDYGGDDGGEQRLGWELVR